MSRSITWKGTVTAVTSVAHAGDTRGTISMLRREQIIQPDNTIAQVPIISGNSLRGRLRRIAEGLLREVLGYEGQLTPAAAHVLRSGGSLTKVAGEPLSGSRLADVRTYLPLIAVFGSAAGGRVIDGCLQVGKAIPLVTETDHLTGATSRLSSYDIVQLENYTRLNDADNHDFPATCEPATNDTQMLYQLETYRAGTTFTLSIHLDQPTELEAAFFTSVMAAFLARPRLGGRLAVGLGHATASLNCHGTLPTLDWADWLKDHRTNAISALGTL